MKLPQGNLQTTTFMVPVKRIKNQNNTFAEDDRRSANSSHKKCIFAAGFNFCFCVVEVKAARFYHSQ